MRKIFFNEELDHQFKKEGYVVLRFLNHKMIKSLNDFFLSARQEEEISGFHTTHFTRNRSYKRKEAQLLIQTFKERLSDLLINYTICFGSYMIKKSGENSIMPLHADWSYVDEDKHISISLWCPLVDTDETNGAIGVVPRSHLIVPSLRGPRIPSSFHDLNEYIIEKYGQILPMKAGEVLIYDHRLLHFSPPNLSGIERVAVNVAAVPIEADIYHYCILKDHQDISKFTVTSNDFFVEYDHFEKPDLGVEFVLIPNTNVIPTKSELDTYYEVSLGNANASTRSGFWQKLKELF